MAALLAMILVLLCIVAPAALRQDARGGDDAQGKKAQEQPIAPPPPQSQSPPPTTMTTEDNATRNGNAVPEKESQTPPDGEEEDNSHCCGHKVRACLSSPGDGMLSLVIRSRENVKVSVITPSFLSADPSEFSTTADGKEIVVKIEMVDVEAAKIQASSNITVKSDVDNCELPVPSQNLGYVDHKSALLGGFGYSSLRTPVVGLSMLAAALILVIGSWAYCRYRIKTARSSEEAKYVELEMGNPSGDPSGAGNSDAGDDGWDKDWDEDWEDTETTGSSSFKLTESFSAKGLASRRTARDGRTD